MDREKIMQGVRLFLEGIGENPEREGLQDTPRRVAEMCEEIFSGIGSAAQLDAGFTEAVGDHLIFIRDITFYSVCEHHLLPFFGKVDILYAPRGNRVAGFSSIARIVDGYARRLQIQERLGRQIADAIMTTLQPAGVMVSIRATQLCASMRGQHKKEMITQTQTIRGELPLDRVQLLKDAGSL